MPDGTPTSAAQPQAPFGSTPATQPTPNRGHEAAGMQKLGVVIQQLQDLLPLVGATSEIGMAVMDTIKKFAKYVPAGSVSPAGQKNQLEQTALKNAQQNQQMQMLKQQQNKGAPQPQAAAA